MGKSKKRKLSNRDLYVYIFAFLGIFLLAFFGTQTVGKVVSDVPDWAVENPDFIVNPENVIFREANPNQDAVTASVQNHNVVYGTGYILKNNQWVAIQFDGNPISGTNWLSGDASSTFGVNNEFVIGENYVLAYACNRESDGGWDCHGNKWMIEGFVLAMEETICAPGDFDCDGNILRRCKVDGSDWEIIDECGEFEVCSEDAGACVEDLPEEPGEPGTESGEEPQAECQDTDWFGQGDAEHKNRLETKGTCTDPSGTSYTDVCVDEYQLRDYTCEPLMQDPKHCGYTTYNCPGYGYDGCEDGACKEESPDDGLNPPEGVQCSETDCTGGDTGMNMDCDSSYTYGICTDASGDHPDTCASGTYQQEWGCENNVCVEKRENHCGGGYQCVDGRCEKITGDVATNSNSDCYGRTNFLGTSYGCWDRGFDQVTCENSYQKWTNGYYYGCEWRGSGPSTGCVDLSICGFAS